MTTAERTDIRQVPSVTENPYWEIVREIEPDDLDMKYGGVFSPQSYPRLRDLRDAAARAGEIAAETERRGRDRLVRRYSWAIPDPVTLQFIAALSSKGIVEVGAGTGYWAWQLSQLGVDVVAYDLKPPHVHPNGFHQLQEVKTEADCVLREDTFFDVQPEDAAVAAARHSDRVLMLCWPPYRETMAVRALEAFQGDRVIYIGEGDGGCTGGARFHATLAAQWDEVATHRPVQWYGMHDWVTVYDRAPEPRPLCDLSEAWCMEDPDEDEEEP